MKKVNFFNFPTYNIYITKNQDKTEIRKKSNLSRKRTFKKTTFNSWCKASTLENEKLNVKVVFKAE